jgi:exodeoxyribonuclease V beta subunit
MPGIEKRAGGYIRGFIDLIFQFGGRFYIADWKSNRLEQGYGVEAMEQSMTDADYHLQYTIYTLATLRWLEKRLGPAFDGSRHFGGIFYFYVRGMGRGEGQGIYHVPPEQVGVLPDLERAVMKAALA